MSLSQEQPPISVDEELSEFLNRRFVDVGNELVKPSKFPQRKEMPYKPQTGDVHYFGDPATHNYDASITAEGFWGLTSGGWLGMDSASGGGAPITSVFGRTGAILALQADYDAFFLTLAEGNANYLGITSKAVDSDLLDGIDSTGFLLVGAKAADSELLDGIDILNIARTDIAEIFTNDLTIQGTLAVTGTGNNALNYDGNRFDLTHTAPLFAMIEDGGTVNNTVWDFFVNTDQLRFRLLDDARTSNVNWLTVDRTLNVADLVTILAPLNVVGDVTLSGLVDTRDIAADGIVLDAVATTYLLVGAKAADSELLDGIDSLNFARTDIAETFTNDLTIEGISVFGDTTHTSNDQFPVNLFGASGAAQSGAFNSKLNIFGGATQTRHIELYQIPSGDAFIDSTFSSLQIRALVAAKDIILSTNAGNVSLDSPLITTSTVDGRDVDADGTKLDTIETNAKDDQTAAEIEAIVSHDNLIDFLTTEHFLQSAISITLSQVSDSGALAALGTVGTTQIDNDAVTFPKMQNIPTANILGRVTAATGDVEDLTSTQVTTLINEFTSALKGLAPSSGGGTVNFLRADGTWIAPAGSGGNVSSVGVPLNNQIAIWTTASTIEGDPDFTFDGLNLSIGGTVDGRDVAADGIVLDAIDAGRTWDNS